MSGRGTILVTGGAGFIGSHACKALAQHGYTPVAYDNLSTGHADAVRWGPLVVGDVRDQSLLKQTLSGLQVSAVLHFAASAYVGESMQQPVSYFDNNVGGMISLLKSCITTSVRQIVLSSSCATYGSPDQLPIREDTPQLPINPYGRSKLICEEMLHDAAAAHDLHYVALRYFNAAGCDPDGELCERHDPETHLLPLAMQAAVGRRGALNLFGVDYPTRDGSCERDYIHVSDLARGHVQALQYLEAGQTSCALNLGSGRGHTVLEALDTIRAVTGLMVPYVAAPRRAGDPASLVADPDRAAQVLSFSCKRSDLPTIIRDAAPGFGLPLAPVPTATPQVKEAQDATFAAE